MHINLRHIPLRRGALVLQLALASLSVGGMAHAEQAPASVAKDGQTLGGHCHCRRHRPDGR
jgi:outer membrane receptor for ferric coprogen and ferric-rhodotorulic acid